MDAEKAGMQALGGAMRPRASRWTGGPDADRLRQRGRRRPSARDDDRTVPALAATRQKAPAFETPAGPRRSARSRSRLTIGCKCIDRRNAPELWCDSFSCLGAIVVPMIVLGVRLMLLIFISWKFYR